jgi:hypothetical protein
MYKDEDEVMAVPYNEQSYEGISYVSGSWEQISKMILLIKEMGYIEMRLYYGGRGIWILEWHNPEHDNYERILVEI